MPKPHTKAYSAKHMSERVMLWTLPLLALLTHVAHLLFPDLKHIDTILIVIVGLWALALVWLCIDIHDVVRQRANAHWMESAVDANPQVKQWLEEALSRGDPVQIRWLGMSMFDVWGAWHASMAQVLRSHPAARVTLEIIMLDSDLPWIEQANSAWHGRTPLMFDNVKTWLKDNVSPGLTHLTATVRRYAETPCIHGIVIECGASRRAIVGLCNWHRRQGLLPVGTLQYQMLAGTLPYELLESSNSDDRARMDIFDGWFDMYRSKYTPAFTIPVH